MIDGLIAGRLHAKPEARTSRNGNSFVTARVLVSVDAEERLFVNVIAFDDDARRALLALAAGESVALAGSLTPKTYEAKDGTHKAALDMVAHAVLTTYHVRRKRKATEET